MVIRSRAQNRRKPSKFRPKPGSMAARILIHVQANPGVSTNGLLTALDLNPSPARTCLKLLMSHELIVDNPNEHGHHSYTITERGDLACQAR